MPDERNASDGADDADGDLMPRIEHLEARMDARISEFNARYFATLESWNRLVLSLAGIVFGLTVSFVTPDLHRVPWGQWSLLAGALFLLAFTLLSGLTSVVRVSSPTWREEHEV